MDMSYPRFFVFQEVVFILPVIHSAECRELPLDIQRSRYSPPAESDNLRVPAMACGFNRSMQRLVQIFQLVFHSLAFFLGADLIVSPPHLAWLVSK